MPLMNYDKWPEKMFLKNKNILSHAREVGSPVKTTFDWPAHECLRQKLQRLKVC